MFLQSNILDRIRLPFRKDRELYASLREVLGFYPHHIRYYKQALLHNSSASPGRRGAGEHNERMEFLGDAVLESITSDILYHHFQTQREGFLTNTRSKIVQRDTLNRLAREMGLESLIHSSGQMTSHNSYMGGNAFEALVGAIYLDRGYDACMHFMRNRILKQLLNVDNVATKEVNFKSKLIEWCQKNRISLEFRLISEQRDSQASPIFTTRIILEGLDGETGKGYSKKESHQQAAKATLRALRTDKTFVEGIFNAKTLRTAQEEMPTASVPEV